MTTSMLTVTKLYPNAVQPGFGQFVETRLLKLLEQGDYNSRVVAPVPWFPFKHKMFSAYARFSQVPKYEVRQGIPIWHPRYVQLPKVGMHFAPNGIFRALKRSRKNWSKEGYDPQIIDSHYFYPDGVAGALLAKALDVPLLITARGTDVNIVGEMPRPARRMRAAANQAGAVIAVSAALAERMEAQGVPGDKIHILRNGVDLEFFSPNGREQARAEWRLDGHVILSAGNLVELKGHDLIIDAMTSLPDVTLVIAGSGELDAQLKAHAQTRGVASQVRFLGQVDRATLQGLYAAADALVLASSREGMPNVLLESLACGTPVIAANVGGCSEVVTDSRAGQLLPERTSAAIAAAVQALREEAAPRAETRKFATKFSWDDTIHRFYQLIHRIL